MPESSGTQWFVHSISVLNSLYQNHFFFAVFKELSRKELDNERKKGLEGPLCCPAT